MNRAPLKIGILEGDDIGHEIVPASVAIARAAAAKHGLAIDWRALPIGAAALATHGSTLPKETLDALPTLDGWILGPIGHRAYPKVPEAINPHPILRKRFDLFANVRPTRSYPGIGCLHDGIDLVIVRENNEGFQPDRNMFMGQAEFRPTEDITLSMRVITRRASYRVAKAALELARRRRKHMTFVHKDTVFKLGCGMFVEECRRAAAEYPDVKVDDVIVDTFAMRLVRDPQSFDVVVTTNMFGDILSDEAAGLVGGLGMARARPQDPRRGRCGAGDVARDDGRDRGARHAHRRHPRHRDHPVDDRGDHRGPVSLRTPSAPPHPAGPKACRWRTRASPPSRSGAAR